LTKEAALTFVMLEKIGQEKISIFLEPSDQWASNGFTMIKDTFGENIKSGSQDLTRPAAAYPVNLRTGIVIENPNLTGGIYPKLLYASGKNIPSHTPGVKLCMFLIQIF